MPPSKPALDELPPGVTVDTREVHRQLHELAARGLSRLCAVLAALLMTGAMLELWVLQERAHLAPNRLSLGIGLAIVAALTWLAQRRGHPRVAATLCLVGITLAVAWHSWAIGLGVYSTALSGVPILAAAAGMLLGLRTASILTALFAVLVLVLAGMDGQGTLNGRQVLMGIAPFNRMIGLALLGAGGLLAAGLMHRMVTRALLSALAEQGRLATLLRIGSDWSWEMNAAGHLTYLSPAFEQRSGRTVAEFMKLTQDGGPQIVPDAQWELLRQEMRERRPYRERVITMRCQDGTLLAVRGNGDPVYDASGRFTGWRGVSRNITAERLAQQEQQRTQAMLDRMVQTSPDAICVSRGDGTLLMVNHGFAEFAGRPEAELLGRTAVEVGMWSKAESLRLRDAIGRDGSVRDHRATVPLPGGSVREVAISAGAFEWDGEPAAVITTRDISDIERARLETDAILDNAVIGIALVRARRFERVNPVFEAMFGHTPGGLAGQDAAVMFKDAAAFEAFDAHAEAELKQGRALDLERDVPRSDGTVMRVRLRARAVDATRLAERGTIWVAEDITERRRVERELGQAKQLADAASEAKSAFLATMSHEIRTPLNGVLGLAQLLQDEQLDVQRRREYLGHLVDSAEQLAGIVSDVLDLSKIEAGHLDIEDISFDLHGVVTSTFHTFAPLGRERGLSMSCAIDAEVVHRVRGDPVRLRQILANFLSNALKFTAAGEIALRVSLADNGLVRLAVRDSGPGVSADVRARLFRPFVQADGSTTRRFGGTGLGLSICRELAERMGGSVGVDSDGDTAAPGQRGSTFWAELRLPVDVPATTTAPPSSAHKPLAGMRVLVAEDNAVNMLIVCAMLERLGALPYQAEDGGQALSLALDLAMSPDTALHAVLMDLHMPLVDGLQATRDLHADARTATLPVFALSAAALENEREAARAAGMLGFIAKPVVEAELLRALQSLGR
jgi:PAS domain S-box-containing protein